MLLPGCTPQPKPVGRWSLRKEHIEGYSFGKSVMAHWWVLRHQGTIFAAGPEFAPVAKYLIKDTR